MNTNYKGFWPGPASTCKHAIGAVSVCCYHHLRALVAVSHLKHTPLVVAMNGDHRYYHSTSSNAVAGPSKPPQAPSPPSPLGSLGGTTSATGDAGSSSSLPHHPGSLSSVELFLPPPGMYFIC